MKTAAEILHHCKSQQGELSAVYWHSTVIKAMEEYKEQFASPVGIFKHGDKITLNTGYGCDKGEVLADYGNVVFWKDKDNNKYCSPRDNYKITLCEK